MSPDEFSALAVGLGPGVSAKAIFDTVQFRSGPKAFATLGWPEQGWAVVKVDPAQQSWALSLSDGVAREPGRRRNGGIVLVRLAAIDAGVAIELLAAAWSHVHRTTAARGRAASKPVLAPRLSA